MKAILINAKDKKIEEVEIEHSLENIYKTMGVQSIEAGFYIGKNCCYIDEEGFVNGSRHVFYYGDHTMFGNGLMVGTDDKGNDIDCMLSIEDVEEYISFPRYKHEQWIKTLFKEKGIKLDTKLECDHTILTVLDYCALMDNASQDEVKNKLVQIDFKNGDVLHFMNYLARGMSL